MISISLILLSIGILLYGVVPLFADLSATHAFNADWPAHARFHIVSQVLTNFMVALVSLYLIWKPSPFHEAFINISVWLSFCVIGGFFMSSVFWSVYKGALTVETDVSANPQHRNFGANALIFASAGFFVLLGKLIRQSSEHIL